jgi:hypothetical protein
MTNNEIDRKFPSLVWPVAALGVGGIIGLWFGFTRGESAPTLLAFAVLAVAAAVGIVWRFRARAARRLRAALDAYAEWDIARMQRWNAPKQVRLISARGSRLPSRRASRT